MDSEQTVLTLWGSNQQKVVLSRWIEANRRVLVLEEPTIGVDVGSKAEIYDLIGEALTSGVSVARVFGFRGSGAHLPSRAGVRSGAGAEPPDPEGP